MAKVSPAQFVRQVRQEINRISWASRRETGTATLTVFIMTTIAALFFLLVDWVLSNGVQFVLGSVAKNEVGFCRFVLANRIGKEW
jgi:preprotein translocase subunit SecE